MKKILLFITTLLTVTTATGISANEGAYVQALGGAGWPNSYKHDAAKFQFNTGYLTGVSAGYELCNGIRIEGEYSYRHNNGTAKFSQTFHEEKSPFKIHGKTKTSLVTHAGMANLLWNAPLFDGLKTYVGAGIGYARNKTVVNRNATEEGNIFDLNNSKKDKSTRLSWQAIVGVARPITDEIDLGVEYRFFQVNSKIKHNDLVFSLKYGF